MEYYARLLYGILCEATIWNTMRGYYMEYYGEAT